MLNRPLTPTKSFRTYLLRSLLLGAVALLAGCGGASSGSGGGSILRIGDDASHIDTLNPFSASNDFSLATFRMIYPYLVQYDSTEQITGDLATSHTTSTAGDTYTFNLSPNAHWSDGQPLTANDAAWTIRTIMKYQSSSAAKLAAYVAGIKEIRAPTSTRLVVRYAAPTSTALFALAQIPILPEHVWRQYAQGSGAQLGTFANLHPIGAGPYRLRTYAQNQLALFTRNSTYYGPAPKLSGFGFQFFSSGDAMINALRSGAIDVAFEVPPTTAHVLQTDKALNVHITPGTDTVLLGFNSSKSRPTHRELLNPLVRQAIDLSLDRQQAVSVVAAGAGTASESIIPPSLKQWSDPAVAPPTRDVAKANQILDSLGYHRGPSGIRVANGHAMSYDLYTCNTCTGVPRILNLIESNLQQIGIKITAHVSDFPGYDAAIYGPHGKYAGFDFSLDDYGALLDPASQLALPTCAQLKGTNETGYCNAQYDALYARQGAENGAARVATVHRMQELVARDRPLLAIYTASAISATRAGVNVDTSSPLVINYESKQWLTKATK